MSPVDDIFDEPLKIVFSDDYQRYLADLTAEEMDALRNHHFHAFETLKGAIDLGYQGDNPTVVVLKEWVEDAEAKGLKFDWLAREKSTGDTLLHKLACIEEAGEMIDWAITHGANPNATNDKGQTALQKLIVYNGDNDDIAYGNIIALTDAGTSLVRPYALSDMIEEMQQVLGWPTVKVKTLVGQLFNNATLRFNQFFHHDQLAFAIPSFALREMDAESIKQIATLDLHHNAMHPSRWQGKEDVALRLLTDIPPYLQDELAAEMRGLMGQSGQLPDRPLRKWTAAVSSTPAEARARA